MSFFSNLFSKLFGRKKKQDNWLEETRREVAQPKNVIAPDPNAPWNT